MTPELTVTVLLVVVALAAVALLVRRYSAQIAAAFGRHSPTDTTGPAVARPEFPAAGLLVPDDVLRSAGSGSAAIWDALEAAAAPVAVEYHPVGDADLAYLRTAPADASAQRAMGRIVDALNPKSATLFRVVLPAGAELVQAAGTSGLRGVPHHGRDLAHAILKPVAAGGAVAAGWPALAVAGTVFAVDRLAQREQRAYQHRVEAGLAHQDERYYRARIADQRTADAQLSRALSLLLDGHQPTLDLALKSAYDEFHRAQAFLERFRGVDVQGDAAGRVDFRRLEAALGGGAGTTDDFVRELHLSRAAIAILRKAVVTDAAARALADPGNPYTALRTFIDAQVQQLGTAEADVRDVTDRLGQVELTGRWYDSARSVAARQESLRARIAPSTVDADIDLRYVLTPSGETLQVLPTDDTTPSATTRGE